MTPTFPLYKGLIKAKASAAFLLQTKVIGLNAQPANIYIPNITPQCTCGWPTQLVHYVLLFCSHCSAKNQLFASAGTNNITQMFFTNKGLHIIAKWLMGQRVFQQFQTAQEIQQRIQKAMPHANPLRTGRPRLVVSSMLACRQTLLLLPFRFSNIFKKHIIQGKLVNK